MTEENIIFIDENIPLLERSLSVCGKIIEFKGRELTKEELATSKAKYLFVRSTTRVNSALLSGTDVKFVGTATSGIDHIDTEYLSANDIHFVSAPGANANSVAEYVVFSILLYKNLTGFIIPGKVLGVVGYGNVGKIVARYAKNMGFNVFINDPPLADHDHSFPEDMIYTDLNTICRECDIITNHVPLTREGESRHPTFRLFDEERISDMKKQALFIHASRGWVADEEPLIKRMKEKSLVAAIDVFENEPLIDPAVAKPAIISTPHIAGYSRDGKLKGSLMMAEEFEKFSGLEPDMTPYQQELASYKPLPEKDFTDNDKLFQLLKHHRKLDIDHQNFLKTLDLPESRRAEAFDRLRKEYPVRRECL